MYDKVFFSFSLFSDTEKVQQPQRRPRLEDASSSADDSNSLQFKYRLIPPPPVDQVITPAPAPTKVYSYSPLPPNHSVVNSLPPLTKPDFLGAGGAFIRQPPAAQPHSYHQYPGYFPEPYIIEKKVARTTEKKHAIKKTQPGFPKQPRTVLPPPDIEHVAPPSEKENPRNGKSNYMYTV